MICQSCGMPMPASEHFGTRKNGIPEKEYCCFCFKEGEFTDDVSVYEQAAENVRISGETVENGEYHISDGERILQETVKLQQLRRWKSHAIHEDYYTSVYRVLEYINRNLANVTDLDKLAEIAHISKYHFHRIFKAILNESPGEYIQRLKLEKAAFKLHTTKLTLKEIADRVGYQTAESLSKAFKKRYGMNPKEFRQSPSDLTSPLEEPVADLEIEPEIRIIPEISLLCFPVRNAFADKYAFKNAWTSLLDFVDKKNGTDLIKGYYCLSRDVSTHTTPDKCRMYACVEVEGSVKPLGKYSIQHPEGGKYAVFKYSGSPVGLEGFYCNIYRYWVPKSEFTLRDSLHFEKYLNDFTQVNEDALLMEIYIPISP